MSGIGKLRAAVLYSRARPMVCSWREIGFAPGPMVGSSILHPPDNGRCHGGYGRSDPRTYAADTFLHSQGTQQVCTASADVLNRKSLELRSNCATGTITRSSIVLARSTKELCMSRDALRLCPRHKCITTSLTFCFSMPPMCSPTPIKSSTNSLVNRLYAHHVDPNAMDCDHMGMSTLTSAASPASRIGNRGTASESRHSTLCPRARERF